MATSHNSIFEWQQLETEKDRSDYVYFIKNKHADLIKIGRSYNPQKRFFQIAKEVMSIEATIELNCSTNSASLEKHLHKYFAKSRIEGEWFIPTQELEDLIHEIKAGRINV